MLTVFMMLETEVEGDGTNRRETIKSASTESNWIRVENTIFPQACRVQCFASKKLLEICGYVNVNQVQATNQRKFFIFFHYFFEKFLFTDGDRLVYPMHILDFELKIQLLLIKLMWNIYEGAIAFEHVLLLNATFEPLNIINWKRAIKLLFLEKVEVVKESDYEVHSVSRSMRVPSIVRLVRFIGFSKKEVKFSRENIYARDRFQCQYCGNRYTPQGLTYDHIIPRSRGGKTEWSNIVTCCIACNRLKGGKTPEEAGLHLRKKPSKPSWLWGFQSRFAIQNPPIAWKEYLFLGVELVE